MSVPPRFAVQGIVETVQEVLPLLQAERVQRRDRNDARTQR